MILVDSSVWIDHLRDRDRDLVAALNNDEVLMHPCILGELALGTMPDRAIVLQSLRRLPRAIVAHGDEVLRLIEREALSGLGIGYADAHLLASARLSDDTRLWTRDRRLAAVAARLGLATGLPH